MKKAFSEKEPIEKKLWQAADSLRKNIDAAEYKHIVLGLIFLKYISDSFEARKSRNTKNKKTKLLAVRSRESGSPIIYKDEPGFCASVSIQKIRELDYILSPGRYVGLPEENNDFNFAEKFTELKNHLNQQMKEEAKLNSRILKNLSRIDT